MKITWLGHSCFTVESQGYKIVLDPYRDGSVPGLAPVRVEADNDAKRGPNTIHILSKEIGIWNV